MKKLFLVFCLLFTSFFCFGLDATKWPEKRTIYISDWYDYECDEDNKIYYYLSSVKKIANSEYYEILFTGIVETKLGYVYTVPFNLTLKAGDKICLNFLGTGDECYITKIYTNGLGLTN